jgi:hexosaminidase
MTKENQARTVVILINNMKKSILTLAFMIIASLFFIDVQAQSVQKAGYNVIPYPAVLQPAKGFFTINSKTALILSPGAAMFKNERDFMKTMLSHYLTGETLDVKKGISDNSIIIRYDAAISAEAYKLSITPTLIVITAKEPAGVFYATETLRQLLPKDIETGRGKSLVIPAVEIEDKPAFKWRGMMLDVSRSFFSIQYLQKMVDMMSMYKLNKFHLHLTDDQGWRIEIKKYPQLTLKGGWRQFIDIDSNGMKELKKTGNTDFEIDPQNLKKVNGKTLYGGFYTQAEMRAFIKYAAKRHIEIIPEIDMPGHMMAATQIFPYLNCDPGPKFTNGFSNPICPCNPAVLEFAKDIFTEIADLFPSKYIHIGGDEVEKTYWEKSPVAQSFMKENGFKSTSQIQSYFNDYISKFFHSKGKTLIGWDEIVEGGIDSSAMVMFWRPWAPDAPKKSAKNGNKIIMSPDGPLYFDAPPEGSALFNVYHYNPLDTMYHFTKNEQSAVIGVQANLWSQLLPSEKRADYLLMPRMTALAEVGWTYRPLYASYLKRLDQHYARWDALKINYRLPDPENIVENHVFIKQTSFFQPAPSNFIIRYTTDGSQPTISSPEMRKEVVINRTLDLKLAPFATTGRRGDVYTLHFKSVQYNNAVNITTNKNGLHAEFYKGRFKTATNIKGVPDSVFNISAFKIPASLKMPGFALKFSGYISVPETGIYTLALNSDDGSVLYIDNNEVINNDGLHSEYQKSGQAALKKGLHKIDLNYIQGDGGYLLDLRYALGNDQLMPIPETWFSNK